MIELHTSLAFLMSNDTLLRKIKLRTDRADKRQVIINEWLFTLMINSIDAA